MTPQEALTQLQRMQACPGDGPIRQMTHAADNDDGKKCRICQNTGQVPAYPALWEKCWTNNDDADLIGTCQGPDALVAGCRFCDGSGLRPKALEDVHLGLLARAAYDSRKSMATREVLEAYMDALYRGESDNQARDAALLALAAADERKEA